MSAACRPSVRGSAHHDAHHWMGVHDIVRTDGTVNDIRCVPWWGVRCIVHNSSRRTRWCARTPVWCAAVGAPAALRPQVGQTLVRLLRKGTAAPKAAIPVSTACAVFASASAVRIPAPTPLRVLAIRMRAVLLRFAHPSSVLRSSLDRTSGSNRGPGTHPSDRRTQDQDARRRSGDSPPRGTVRPGSGRACL